MNFKGEIGSKIIIIIIKKDLIVFLIVFGVEVKVCIEGKWKLIIRLVLRCIFDFCF